ncbi:hypothetical protein KI387_030629 [Taxus chinensis]|uniref:C2 NT-type domain-containing protein n=1 Tax=Taxus chinensis TaxID=29808 RepID=A0AA38FEP4_TAXCH|nr:hypothetical protein KI387_030629 [Taxus chinensis]
MGGPSYRVEPICDLTWKANTKLWKALEVDGFTYFIQRIKGHDIHIYPTFSRKWKDRVITFRGKEFTITENLISFITGLGMEGIKFYRNKFDKENEEKRLMEEDGALQIGKSRLLCSSLPPPYNDVAKMVACFWRPARFRPEMVVKMMKWRPWPPLCSKKFKVKLVLHCLEGLVIEGDGEGLKMGVNVKWKGPKGNKLGSRFRRNVKRNCSAFQPVGSDGVVEWNEDFENVCVLTMGKEEGAGFQPWEVCLDIVHNSMHEPKTKPSIIGTSFLNLGELVSSAEDAKQTKIAVSYCIGGVTSEAAFSITIAFVELQTSQEALDPVHKFVVPSLPFIGANLLSEKEEFSAFKAGLRKVKVLREYVVVGRSKKVSEEEDGSDDKLSPRSEEHESADMLDSDSVDACEHDEAVGVVGSRFRESFSYGTLATANLVVEGVLYLDLRDDVDGDNWMMNSLPSVEPIPKLVDEPSSDSDHAVPQTTMRSLLSWKKRKVTFRSPKERGEPLLNKAYGEEGGDDIDFDRRQSGFPIQPLPPTHDKDNIGVASNISGCLGFGADNFAIGSWDLKELVSRDGEMSLSTKVFFASIDQRSERAAGESACTALVAVIADWLQKNSTSMPIKSQFDTLIQEGSLEWRKLCEVEAYKERFSDGHFDLETILQAKLRPLSVIPGKSFIGFFQPEGLGDSCEFLQGVMSFDSMWEEITNGNNESQNGESKIYIVSWNDHFFVLKVEKEAYYIIDTLGERLFEGCNQAYILKFDNDTEMYRLPPREQKSDEDKNITNLLPVTLENVKSLTVEKASQLEQENAEFQAKDTEASENQENGDNEKKVICRGKECCKEFIKEFLAAIPLKELQMDIKKGLLRKTTLDRRLQIEFHFTAESNAP